MPRSPNKDLTVGLSKPITLRRYEGADSREVVGRLGIGCVQLLLSFGLRPTVSPKLTVMGFGLTVRFDQLASDQRGNTDDSLRCCF